MERKLLNNYDSIRYPFIQQFEQQCHVETKNTQAQQDVQTLSTTTRSTIERMDDYTSRLEQVQRELRMENISGTTMMTASQDIESTLSIATSRRSIIGNQSMICPHCQQTFLRYFLNDHLLICQRRRHGDGGRKKRKEENSKQTTTTTTDPTFAVKVKPLPPRNLRIQSTSFDSLTIGWDDPILDGGEPIQDYKISFGTLQQEAIMSNDYDNEQQRQQQQKQSSKKWTTRASRRQLRRQPHEKKDDETSGTIVTTEFLCSRFCLREPIPYNNQFVLDGLEASREYFNIRLKCRNRIGWSDYSESIVTVTTSDPIDPMPPQRLTVTNVTSDSIDLSWSKPFHSGGGKLKGYELTYLETIPNDTQIAGANCTKTKLVERKVKIQQSKTTHQLLNLRDETQYTNFELKAINHFDLTSKPATCNDVMTLHETLEIKRIEKEIARVKSITSQTVDSDFFFQGVVQREDRISFLEKLEKERRVLSKRFKASKHGDDDDGGVSMAQQMVKEKGLSVENQAALTVSMVTEAEEKEYNTRKERFEYRIDKLKDEIEELTRQRQDLISRRSYLIYQMESWQERIIKLRAELVRLSTISSGTYSSDVPTGTKQSFDIYELRQNLHGEMDQLEAKISESKINIIRGDEECVHMLRSISLKEKYIEERKVAYEVFHKRENKLKECISNDNTLDVALHCLSIWKAFTVEQSGRRRSFNVFLKMKRKISLILAVRQWKVYSDLEKQSRDVQSNYYEIISKGGLMLIDAKAHRCKNVDAVSGVMKRISALKYNFEGSDVAANEHERVDHNLLPQAESFLLLKGDFYADLGQYETAIQLYKTVIDQLSSVAIEVVHLSSVQCILLNKIIDSYMKLQSWHQAILYIERLLFNAKNAQLHHFSATGCLKFGECFKLIGRFDLAKEQYMNALVCCKHMDNNNLESQAHLGLHLCHKQGKEESRALQSRNRYDSLVVDKKGDIKCALSRLEKLQSQLVNVTAKTGCVISLQHASNNFSRAINEKKKIKSGIKIKKQELIDSFKELQELNSLMADIQEELKKVAGCKDSRMRSSMVHGNDQKFDKDELMERLELRLNNVTNEYERCQESQNSLSVDLKNLKDDLDCVEQDLDLEENALTQRVLKNRLIRCMTLNSSNTAGNDVSGNGRGGKKTLAITIEKDLYIHNIESGQVEEVFLGDIKGQHLGEIRGHTANITCLYFESSRAYTGSMDKTIICWNMEDNILEYIARGHQATVTCIHVDSERMVSGSADTFLICWNSHTGNMIRRIPGHSCGISCLQCGQTWCVSGDIEGEIFMWDEQFRCTSRLKLSGRHKVTVLKNDKLEIISGSAKGLISMWWMKTKSLLKECKAHDGRITDIQFDATKLVSSGADCLIKVIDVTTFQILQTLRGHKGHVLSVAFDNKMIVSLSNDGSFHQWSWGSKSRSSVNGELHTVTLADTLNSICKKYNISLHQVLKWNKHLDTRKLTPGQMIIVSDATIEKEVRSKASSSSAWAESTGGDSSIEALEMNDSEAHKNYYDQLSDPTSLASRLHR